MKEKTKVLYFVDRMLRGGIQTLVIDWISHFNKEKLQIDFLLLDDGNKYELEEDLRKMGCKVFKLNNVWIKQPFDFIKLDIALDKFFKEHNDYNVVHLHSTSKNYMVLKKAKKYGIKTRIAHSHSTGFQSKNILKSFYGNLLKKKLLKYSTNYFACSEAAGVWLFGKNIIKSDKFQVIKNGVDYEKFKFDDLIRKNIRKSLKIDKDTIVVGHVGRFTKVKNHKFLIKIFNEYQKLNPNSILILIGTGILEDEIKKLVSFYKLNEKVLFVGFKSNICDYLQAMDVFIFPSLKEGLGIGLIEAQASGLYCFASKNRIPKDVNMANNMQFLSLEESAKIWAQKIDSIEMKRYDNFSGIKEKGYLLDDVVKKLEYFYTSNNGEI